MKHYLFDIETTPMPEAHLMGMMPGELANPVMPAEIKNPMEPDHTEGCPKYATKEHPEGDPEKRAKWIEGKRTAWADKTSRQRDNWETDIMQKQQRFFDQAALSASTGQVRMMNTWDTTAKGMSVVIQGATPEQRKRIDAGKFPVPVSITYLKDERELVVMFYEFCRKYIQHSGVGTDPVLADSPHLGGRLVGYNLALFDLIFLFHKAWILGEKAPRHLRDRNPRYWSGPLVCDIREVWKLGDPKISTGGLDGLTKILGLPRKTGTGEGFWRLWRDDAFAAVLYSVTEMQSFRAVAERMGEV